MVSQSIETTLAGLLEQRGYVALARIPGNGSRVGYVLALYGDRRLVIRCRRYEERTDPDYVAAFESAVITGKVASNCVLTFDGIKGTLHYYTLHVAQNSGNVAQLAAAILAIRGHR